MRGCLFREDPAALNETDRKPFPSPPPLLDANLFKKAFLEAQEINKSLLSGSSQEAPTPVESDAPVAADATSVTQTGAPVEKGKEVAKEEVVEAEGDKLPEYKDEGVVPPPEKTEVVQGEEVKQPTEEVRFTLSLLFARRGSRVSSLGDYSANILKYTAPG